MGFTHSHSEDAVYQGSRKWGDVDKTKLPPEAFANYGHDSMDRAKVTSWSYPHHIVVNGSGSTEKGRFTDGTLKLHKGGVDSAWSYMQRNDVPEALKEHIMDARETIYGEEVSESAVPLVEQAGVGSPTIDRDAGAVRDVAIMGLVNETRSRSYPADVVKDAIPMFEGIPYYIDPADGTHTDGRSHPSPKDLIGHIKNVRFSESTSRLVGDVFPLPTMKEWYFGLVDQMSDSQVGPGNSPKMWGQRTLTESGSRVKAIKKVSHVDLVANPGTTTNLSEEAGEMDWSDITVEALSENRPGIVSAIKAEASGDDDDGDVAALRKRVDELQESQKELKEERDKLLSEKQKYERQEMIEDLLSDSDLPEGAVTDELRELLSEAEGEEQMKKIISHAERMASKATEEPESFEKPFSKAASGEEETGEDVSLDDESVVEAVRG